MAHGTGAYTIVAYSSHPVEEGGIDLEWCKEVEDEIRLVVHGNCSMDLATLDKQVDHSHGLQVAVAGPVEVGMDYRLEEVGTDYQLEKVHMDYQFEVAEHKEMASAASSYRGEGEHTQPLLAAQEDGSMVFEDEDLFAVVKQVSELDVRQKDSCCCMCLCF